jgi:nitrate reductase NapE component
MNGMSLVAVYLAGMLAFTVGMTAGFTLRQALTRERMGHKKRRRLFALAVIYTLIWPIVIVAWIAANSFELAKAIREVFRT